MVGRVTDQLLPLTLNPLAVVYVVPLIVTARLSPAAKVTVPVTVGVVSFVTWETTVGAAGTEVLILSSLVVVSLEELPAASVRVARTG